MIEPQTHPTPAAPVGDSAAETDSPTAEPSSRRRFDLQGRSLREHAARGTILNSAFMVGLSGLGFLRGFLLAAFLTREDYGLWGVVAVSLGTLLWLRTVGIGDRYVQQDEEDQDVAFQKAFTLQMGLTGASVLVLLAALPGFIAIYGEPDLLWPGLAMIASLPAAALQAPIWIHYREMRFLRQRLLQSVDPVVGFIVTVGLAIAGLGWEAIAIGLLAGAWTGAGAAVATTAIPLRFRYDRGTLRRYWSFSWPLFITSLGGMVIAQSSIIATEAKLGLAGAGAVALAASISQFTDRVDAIVTGTLYPAICAIKDRRALLYESFVKSNRLALMWAVPCGVALALFADDLVTFGIGEKWRPAAILLQVWGVAAALGHIGFNWDAYFRARGETRPMAVASMVAMVSFLAAALPLLLVYGLRGFAIGVGVQMLAHVACRAYFLAKIFDGFSFMRHALRAILPTIPASAAVLLVRIVESGDRTLLHVGLDLVVYVAVTAAVTWYFERGLLREAASYVRGRNQPAGAAA